MYVVLLGIGLVMAAVGFVTIGFGIPINAFSLGNTLILAGTTSVVGGLVLIGLAAAVRQLVRIAEALSGRPMARPARPVDAAEPMVPPVARANPTPARAMPPKPVEATIPLPVRPAEPAMPMPPKPSEAMPQPAEARLAEPRFPVAATAAPAPLDWLRPKSKISGTMTSGNTEPPVVELADEAPLSPRSSPRTPFSPPMAEPAFEPKAWSPSRTDEPSDANSLSRPDRVARLSPSSDRKETGLFDAAWPDRSSPAGEPAQRESRAEPDTSREEPAENKHGEMQFAPSAERPPAILKAGVIDGMPYTLYADGSIEAELPTGTVKFASVDALRAHLEHND